MSARLAAFYDWTASTCYRAAAAIPADTPASHQLETRLLAVAEHAARLSYAFAPNRSRASTPRRRGNREPGQR